MDDLNSDVRSKLVIMVLCALQALIIITGMIMGTFDDKPAAPALSAESPCEPAHLPTAAVRI